MSNREVVVKSYNTIHGLSLHYMEEILFVLIQGWIRLNSVKGCHIPIVLQHLAMVYKDYYSIFPVIISKILLFTCNNYQNWDMQVLLNQSRIILEKRNRWDVEILNHMSLVCIYYIILAHIYKDIIILAHNINIK